MQFLCKCSVCGVCTAWVSIWQYAWGSCSQGVAVILPYFIQKVMILNLGFLGSRSTYFLWYNSEPVMTCPLVNDGEELRGQMFLKGVLQLYRFVCWCHVCLGLGKGERFSSAAGYCRGVEWKSSETPSQRVFKTSFSSTHLLQTSFPIMAYMTMAGWSNSCFLDKLRIHRQSLKVKHLETWLCDQRHKLGLWKYLCMTTLWVTFCYFSLILVSPFPPPPQPPIFSMVFNSHSH